MSQITPSAELHKVITTTLRNKAYRQDRIILDGYSAVKEYVKYMQRVDAIELSIYSCARENYYDDVALTSKMHNKMIDEAKKIFQGNFRIYSRELVQAIRFIESEEFSK